MSIDHDTDAAVTFLQDFYGDDLRVLSAIKKPGEPKVGCFLAGGDRAIRNFIADEMKGFDLYFSPNPLRGPMAKKASKDDVLEARWLWVDIDPDKDKPADDQRPGILALLTTDLPEGLPRPNRVIDSGRGYWAFWKLATPQPVDGNGPLTAAVEAYGRGIENAFKRPDGHGYRQRRAVAAGAQSAGDGSARLRLPATTVIQIRRTGCAPDEGRARYA